MDAEWTSFHPMDNSASACISKDGILKLKDLAGRDDTNWEVMDFSTIAPAGGAKPVDGKADKPKPAKQPKPQKPQ